MSETTFSKWNGTQRGNYCDLPTIDVPIVEETTFHCEGCNGALIVTEVQYGMIHKYAHVDSAKDDGHWIRAKGRCYYCGSSEAMSYRQEAWYDASDCGRCGATRGYAIGD